VQLAIIEAEALLDRPLIEAVTGPDNGEIHPVTVVTDNRTDNGPAFNAAAFARFIAARPNSPPSGPARMPRTPTESANWPSTH
jgi:hypothetical protein